MKLSEKGHSVKFEAACWWSERTKSIHLTVPTAPDESFHVNVRADGSKESGHPSLYRELRKLMVAVGAEPLPPDLPRPAPA
jgi:hypothetical protein